MNKSFWIVVLILILTAVPLPAQASGSLNLSGGFLGFLEVLISPVGFINCASGGSSGFGVNCNTNDTGGGGGSGDGLQAEVSSSNTLGGMNVGLSSGNNCGAGQKRCSNHCIPNEADCCAAVGFANQYCPSGSICRSDGQCESISGGSCADSRGEVCESDANSCGMRNRARRVCNGSCPTATPSDAECPAPNISMNAVSITGTRFVNRGDSCVITWGTSNTTSCSLVGEGANATGVSGRIQTSALTHSTDYTLSCQNGTAVSGSSVVTCQVNPGFEEI